VGCAWFQLANAEIGKRLRNRKRKKDKPRTILSYEKIKKGKPRQKTAELPWKAPKVEEGGKKTKSFSIRMNKNSRKNTEKGKIPGQGERGSLRRPTMTIDFEKGGQAPPQKKSKKRSEGKRTGQKNRSQRITSPHPSEEKGVRRGTRSDILCLGCRVHATFNVFGGK